MGWKLVRDHNEKWCRANGVSGQWRTSPDPQASLRRKIFEEAGEYAEQLDPAELYDLLDVVQAIIGQADPSGEYAARHRAKVAEMGGFSQFTEWCPVPAPRLCEVDGDIIDTYGGEHYWQCGWPGALDIEGTWMCEDHAGERGFGPKQEEYGFGPDDGLNPDRAKEAGR